ncbi:hypothetical protein KA183_20590 [bacterium]|nr:hypothetical protein [bacterium]QQR55755.1 MAG: hypothetical protein IPG59_12100 [Candidatus Melainabacteria bacterium]
MGSFLITRRLDIDPAFFDAAQMYYVLMLLICSFAVGVNIREFFKNGGRLQFSICFGVMAFCVVGAFLVVQDAFHVPELQFLPDLTFIMMVFSAGFFLREGLAFIAPYVSTPAPTPVEIRISTHLDERLKRR